MSTTEHHEYSTKLGHLRFFKNVIPCLPMKHIILIALSLSLFAFSLHATKPDNAGKPDQQKTVQNQSNAHHSDSDAVKSKDQQEKKEKKEKKEKEAKHSADDDGLKIAQATMSWTILNIILRSYLEMGGNQLQIFNGILLKVAAVTIEPEEPGGGAIARAASGGIMGQCSAVIEAARGALADALAGGAVSSKAK